MPPPQLLRPIRKLEHERISFSTVSFPKGSIHVPVAEYTRYCHSSKVLNLSIQFQKECRSTTGGGGGMEREREKRREDNKRPRKKLANLCEINVGYCVTTPRATLNERKRSSRESYSISWQQVYPREALLTRVCVEEREKTNCGWTEERTERISQTLSHRTTIR